MKRKIIKKIGTIFVWSVGTLIFDLAVLFLLLLLPSVQTFVAKGVASYLSTELQVKVAIEKVYISPSLKVILKKVMISDQHLNPMIDSKSIDVDFSKISILAQKLDVSKVTLEEPAFYLKKYASDKSLNIRFLVDYFSSSDTLQSENKWVMKVQSVVLKKASFRFDNYHNTPANLSRFVDFFHLNLKGVDADISNFSLVKDSIRAQVNHLAFTDTSGIILRHFSGSVLYCNGMIKGDRISLETPKSKVFADFSMKYEKLSDFVDFYNRVFFYAKIYKSSIDTKDIGFFIPQGESFNNHVNMTGVISGPLNRLRFQNLVANIGHKSKITLNAEVENIIYPELTHISGDFSGLVANYDDVSAIRLPRQIKISLPPVLAKLGTIGGKGSFKGTYRNFVSTVNIKSNAGIFNCHLKFNTKHNQISYSALVDSDNLDVSVVFPNSGVKKTSIHTEFAGSGITKNDLNLTIKGNINYIEYKDYIFRNSKIDGTYLDKHFNGHVNIDDPSLYLDFMGSIDYSGKVPQYQFVADVDHARLVDLKLIKRDQSSSLSTHLNAIIEGDNIDNYVGEVMLENTHYYENGRMYKLKNLNILSSLNDLGYSSIELKSDWVDMNANGKFRYSDLGSAFIFIMQKYLPSYAPKSMPMEKFVARYSQHGKTKEGAAKVANERRFLGFDVVIKNSEPISALFVPEVKATGKTVVSGFLNTITQNIEFQVKTDSLNIGALIFSDVDVKGNSKDSLLNIVVNCSSFILSKSDSLVLQKINCISSLKKDSLTYSLGWFNFNDTKRNVLNGNIQFGKSPIMRGSISSSNIYINDSLWNVDPLNSFAIDSTEIRINHLNFFTAQEQILVDGVISKNPTDILKVKLQNFDVSQFDKLTNNRNFDLDGIANGEVELSSVYDRFSIIINLDVQGLGVNGQKIGNAKAVSAWDRRKQGLFVNIDVLYRGNVGEAKPVTIQGYYYPKGGILDMQADVLNFKLKVIEPYLKTLFYRVDGLASGKVKIVGTLRRPQIEGKIKLMRTVIGVNFLHTEYTVNQEVRMYKNKIIFDSITAYDTRNNTAVIDGWVSHEDYTNFKLDINIKAHNLMGLNTTRAMNEMFYGKAFGTGAVRIYGTESDVKIDAQVEANENTEIFVPISFNTEVDKSSFINFVSKKQATNLPLQSPFIDLGIKMNFLINVTPASKFHIFLDPSTGGSLHGSGNGSIRMNINTNGDFNMYGTYVVSKGQYEMKLKDMFTRTFEIENGGTIQWNGDPTDADIDIRAVLPISANLSSIFEMDSTSSSSSYGRNVKVHSVVKLTGKLLNPEVHFGIELPNSDNTTKANFYNYIDTTNDQKMIRQTFSLLVLGRFEPDNNQYGNIVGDGVGMSSMELISNQLSNFLSQATNDLNVKFNYKMADQVTTEELQIAVSKQLFNDRVSIDGMISAGGQNKFVQNTNNVVGDIVVEVKVTPDGRWKSKVYNIANTNEYTFQNAPYVQGVGLIYRKDFNKLSEFFEKRKKKE